MTSSTAATRPLPVPAPGLAAVVLTFGPVWTVLTLTIVARDGVWLQPDMLPYVLPVALAAWSPLPVGAAGLWLQQARDRLLVDRSWPVRAVALLPALLSRAETWLPTAANLVGLAVAAVAAATAV